MTHRAAFPAEAVEGRRRLRMAFTPGEWRSIGGMTDLVLLLHIVGWGTLVFVVAPHQYELGSTGVLGVGVGLTAYLLGVRHAFRCGPYRLHRQHHP